MEGYKNTDGGLISDDWLITTLGEVITLKRGYDLTYRQIQEGEVPVVTSSGIKRFHNVAKVKGPGVIIGRYGTLGEVFYVKSDYWPHNTTLYVQKFGSAAPEFVFYLLQSIDFASYSGKSAVPGINRNHVHLEVVNIPPLPEQKRIAEILSTWDDALQKLSALLEEKKQLKKGLMQQILSGEKRPSGFEGEWVVYKMTDIADVLFSNVDKKRDDEEIVVKLCNYMDVYRNSLITSETKLSDGSANSDEIRKFSLRKHDVLFTKDSETPNDIAVTSVIAEDLENVVCGYHLGMIRPKEDVYGPFLATLLLTDKYRSDFLKLANGATRFGLSLNDVKNMNVCLPSLEIQKKIESIIAQISLEIEQLNECRKTYSEQRTGLMQQLLTGKKRVKI